MKNTIIAALTVYAYTTICVPTENLNMVIQALLVFCFTKLALKEADKIGRKEWRDEWKSYWS